MQLVKDKPLVLFMKGDPSQPMVRLIVARLNGSPIKNGQGHVVQEGSGVGFRVRLSGLVSRVLSVLYRRAD